MSLESFLSHVPDQTGRVVVITGANSGIGFEAMAMVAAKGATVVMACRSKDKAAAAKEEVVRRTKCDPARIVFVPLNLASIKSVRGFKEEFAKAMGGPAPIHALVCNAGVMALPKRELTEDGLEMQFGTNCAGHYALVATALPLVKAAPGGGRVVFLSSIMHRFASGIHFDDLKTRDKHYDKWQVYCETKLGDLLLMHKLARLVEEKGLAKEVVVAAAHPGYSSTQLQQHMGLMGKVGNALFAQSAPMGATPEVMCITTPELAMGAYAGPAMTLWGRPVFEAHENKAALNVDLQDQFWDACAKLTGVTLEL